MPNENPTLYLVCGKIAAGKSTLACKLSDGPSTILMSEDIWLSRLFANEILTIDDYIEYSRRLRSVVGEHVATLLGTGISVVLDFPVNTDRMRQWMRGISDGAGVAHELHYIDVPDEVCKARLKKRNEIGEHPFSVSEAQYDLLTAYFMAPAPSEGLNVIVHNNV